MIIRNRRYLKLLPWNVWKSLDYVGCDLWRLVARKVVLLLGDGGQVERLIRFLFIVIFWIGRVDLLALVPVKGLWLLIVSGGSVVRWRRWWGIVVLRRWWRRWRRRWWWSIVTRLKIKFVL